eukprot:gene9410-16524_t
MIVPVRCFTCGKVVADKWRAYTRMVDEDKTLTDEERGKILDTLGIKRICCRTVMLTTEEDAIEEVDNEELIRIDEEHSYRMRAKVERQCLEEILG